MKQYIYLGIAIVLEVIGTSTLPRTKEFTKPIPTIIFLCLLGGALFFLTKSLRQIPIGIAYAIWAGAGIVLISVIGYFVYKQKLDIPAIIGIGLIVAGVVVINVFSKSATH